MKRAWIWSLLAISSLFSQACLSADWPQWRGPNRDGISSERIGTKWPAEGPPVQWRANVGTGFSGIAVAAGCACTLGNTNNQDSVWCFDASSGNLKWKYSYSAQLSPQWYEGGPGSTPTISGHRVFTISKWGDVICFDLLKGETVWQRDLRQSGIRPNRWGFAGSPLIWKNLVILNAGESGTALDCNTGQIVWSNGTNATGYASPTLLRMKGREFVLIFAAHDLVALDPETGSEHWRYPWKTDWDTNNSDPIVRKDHIFLSSFSHGCSLLSVADGQPHPVYETKTAFNNLSPGILLGDAYYVFSGEAKKDTELRCVRFSTGELRWSTKEPSFGSLLSTKGNLLVLADTGELQLFADGSLRQNHTPAGDKPQPVARAKVLNGTCWTPPALANGLLYVRNAKGDLRCLNVSSK